MKINYNNRKFHSISNSGDGEVDSRTVFHYSQTGNILRAKYAGGLIVSGQMLGVISENGTLHFHYHHINTEGQIRAGKCDSIPKILLDGRIVLNEKWQWLDGRREAGKSIVEEMVR